MSFDAYACACGATLTLRPGEYLDCCREAGFDDPAQHVARVPAEHTLLSTTDAMVWAEEFCRIFDGRMITAATHPNDDVDAGTMIGWFANAIETGRNAGRRQRPDNVWLEEARASGEITEEQYQGWRNQ